MSAKVNLHPWSPEALFNKALLFVGRMEEATPEDSRYGLWSSMALEVLARAALAHVSPALLADDKDWRNIAFSLGLQPSAKKFSPTSAGTREVLVRLTELVPEFTQELAGFCTRHADRRNAEVHSGEEPFLAEGNSKWLGRFYQASRVLLQSMGKDLKDLFSNPAEVESVIQAMEDAAAKAVQQSVNARRQVWQEMDAKERHDSEAKAAAWATREAGHRARCPACQCTGLVQGTPHGPPRHEVVGEEVVARQPMVPASFQCIACGLQIVGFAKLAACDLADAFTAKAVYTAAEFHGLYTEEELEEARAEFPELEPDFNEY